jgi:diguanylate cyclase (GGDEF)-like protein
MSTLFILFSLSGLAFVVAVIYMSWQDVRAQAVSELRHINAFVYSAFEADLHNYESLLHLLGERLEAMDVLHDPEAGRELLEHMLEMNPNLAGFGVAGTDGRLLLVTTVKKGAPLPNLLDMESSRQSFKAVLESGTMKLGRTLYMKVLGKWVVPLRVPIYRKDGTIAFVMITGIDVQGTKNIWQPRNLPENFSALLVNDEFYFIFVSPLTQVSMADWYEKPIPRSTLEQLDPSWFRQPGTKVFDLRDRNNVHRLVMSEFHPDWAITSVTTIPYATLYYALYERLRYFLLGIMLFYGFALLLYLLINRQEKAKARELLWNASHDTLTRLPNRFFLRKKTQQWHAQHRRYAALFLDLDNFKGVNDNYGHPFGDKLLVVMAQRLQHLIDPHEYVIRQGGDEFIVLTTRPEAQIGAYAREIRTALAEPVTLENIVLHPSASIGIAHYPDDADHIDVLLSKADLALYEAKQRKSGFFMYSDMLEERAKLRYTLEVHLRKADRKKEFTVLLQPQLKVQTLDIVGVEALMRWESPVLGAVDPKAFIPVAEETALIREIGMLIMEKACMTTMDVWKRTGRRFRLSVNCSAEELLYDDYVGHLLKVLEKTGFPGTMLTIEVTESVFIRRVEKAKKVLNTLRQHGIGVSLDDFGTGYSSLSMLSGLPLTELKIDQSFMVDIHKDEQHLAIARSIISLGQMFELEVVAEGAQEEHLVFLKQFGCTVLQGFAYGRPMDGQALCDYIVSRSGAQTVSR